MEDDIVMRELVEIIFGKKSTIHEENVAHLSIRENFLTEDFSKKMADIFFLRCVVVSCRYQGEFRKQSHKMLASHERYLTCVMLACFSEHEVNQSIFDSFISVCAVVRNMIADTLANSGVDFQDLAPDILMVFYRAVLKESFIVQKGLHRFLEYIQGHEYLAWNCNRSDFILADGQISAFAIEKINEKLNKEANAVKEPLNTKSLNKVTARYLARKVLSTTTVKLPTLPGESDLIMRLAAYKKKISKLEIEVKRRIGVDFFVEPSREASSSNSDAKTNHFGKKQEDIAGQEDMIPIIVIQNHLKHSVEENGNNQINEVEGILSQLEDTIKSLNEMLDEYNKK